MSRTLTGWLRWFVALAFLAALSGCPFDDGSDDSSSTASVAPSIATQPAGATAAAGATATFSVTANGTAPLAYQWRRNGADIAGATAASYTTPALVAADNGARFTVVVSNAAGTITSAVATLNVSGQAAVAPSITTQPAVTSVQAGQTATFSVVAAGTAPITYQWTRNGAAIAGATSASYTTPATTAADNGASFAVVVSNAAGQATSSATALTVTAAPVAPAVTAQPANATVNAGQTATFSVTASGTAPLTYQWSRGSTAIPGATGASYTTPATTAADSGATFSVVVTNAAGSATSTAATLTVTPAAVAPAITAQPANVSVTAGQAATFSVTATGTAPLTYQWRRNGTNIAGATAATYTLSAAAAADSGAVFTVVIANAAGQATSSGATLTVQAAAVGVAAVSIAAGSGYTLAVRADGTVLAWGTAMSGGAGPTLAGSSAHVVGSLSNVRAVVATSPVAAGFNSSLAVQADGTVFRWGSGSSATPAELTSVGKVREVQTCGAGSTYALHADGTVVVLTGTSASALAGLSDVVSIGRANTSNLCGIAAVRSNGSVALVTGTQIAEVSGLPAMKQAVCGFDPTGLNRYCLALSTTGRIWAWGSNGTGQLGDGTTTARTSPVELPSPQNVQSLGVVIGTSFALTSAGEVYSWGGLDWLGRDVTTIQELYTPGLVTGLPRVVELATGGHVLVRGSDGSVWGWGGLNLYDEFGTGSTGNAFLPVRASGINLN